MEEVWKYYCPDDGETAKDATEIPQKEILFDDAFWAAKAACEHQYLEYDGWEYIGKPFKAVIITPAGNEVPYIFEFEPSVEYHVCEATQ